MNIKTLVIVLGLLTSTSTKATDSRFFNALHQVESSGRTGRIVGDHGKANGAFQIHREYFRDAAEFDKSLGSDYSRVTDVEFAKRVIVAYLKRYVPKAVETNNYAVLARVHNGGPKGYNNPNTLKYWEKVQKYLN